jgi:REP element-mobilizing transposase RayT
MPDHLHFLAGTSEGGDLLSLMHSFKQKTGWWFKNHYAAGGLKASPTLRKHRPALWQKSYYDHILRREEDIGDVIRYIVENPVRGGLVDRAEDYPFAGTFPLPAVS